MSLSEGDESGSGDEEEDGNDDKRTSINLEKINDTDGEPLLHQD